MNREQVAAMRQRMKRMLDEVGIVMTDREYAEMELADLGLNDFETEGLGIIVYENNAVYCAKELMMLPGQTCPQHRHPPFDDSPGKMETFRCRSGEVYLYVEGEPAEAPVAAPPAVSADHYTVFQEVVLKPGEQYTIPPNTWHWFQAGPDGAVVSEFSSSSRDDLDEFLDPRIRRVPDAE